MRWMRLVPKTVVFEPCGPAPLRLPTDWAKHRSPPNLISASRPVHVHFTTLFRNSSLFARAGPALTVTATVLHDIYSLSALHLVFIHRLDALSTCFHIRRCPRRFPHQRLVYKMRFLLP